MSSANVRWQRRLALSTLLFIVLSLFPVASLAQDPHASRPA
jgi:hypothetical protein